VLVVRSAASSWEAEERANWSHTIIKQDKPDKTSFYEITLSQRVEAGESHSREGHH